YRHRLRCRAERELEVLPQIVLHVDGDCRHAEGLESGFLNFHLVMAGTNAGEVVEASVSGCDFSFDSAIDVNQANGRAGNDSSRGISHRTIDGAGFGLAI